MVYMKAASALNTITESGAGLIDVLLTNLFTDNNLCDTYNRLRKSQGLEYM